MVANKDLCAVYMLSALRNGLKIIIWLSYSQQDNVYALQKCIRKKRLFVDLS
jgi:hypothetical protein